MLPECRSNESGQILIATLIFLLVLSVLGYLAISEGGMASKKAYLSSAEDTASHLNSLAVQSSINWGNANIVFPQGTPAAPFPSYFIDEACANGGIGCQPPYSAIQVASNAPIWSSARTVSAATVQPLSSSLPNATVRWFMEYYGSGLCEVSGCSSNKAPTDLCRCYYYRVTAMTTNDEADPDQGVTSISQVLFKLAQPR